MAGKKARSRAKQYTSKGVVGSKRNKNTDPGQRLINQITALRKGKNVMVTIPNPNKEQTNKPFIRVSGKDWFMPERPPEKKKKKSQFAWENAD